MSNQFEDTFEDGAEDQEVGPKQLRDALKRKDDTIKDLNERLTKFEKQERDRSLNEFVKEKGLPDKAKSLIGDTDPEEWFKEFGDLFAGQATETEEQKPPEQQTALPEQEVTEIQAVNQVKPGTYQPQGDSEMNSQLDSLFSGEKSETEVMEQLKAMGAIA